MTAEVENLILEHLRALRADMSSVRSDIADVKSDLRGVKTHLSGFMQSELAQDGAIAAIRERLDRIERRLELVDE